MKAGQMDWSDALTSPPSKVRLSVGNNVSRCWRSGGSFRWAMMFTCLQFGCALYATFLLFFASVTTVPDVTRSDAVVPWTQGASVSKNEHLQMARRVNLELEKPKNAVCEYEEIAFQQKISNNTKMIDMKTSLFRSACTQFASVLRSSCF